MQLLESLDDPNQKEIDRLWADEVENRIDAYERGELKVIPGEEVFLAIETQKEAMKDYEFLEPAQIELEEGSQILQ